MSTHEQPHGRHAGAYSGTDTIRILLMSGAKGAEPLDPAQWKRTAARVAWVRETTATLREAQREMDDRCTKAVDRLDPQAFDRLFEAEQAKVDAILTQLRAVIDEDRWPRELYFGCL
jgi:hypothetical protein